MKWRIFTAILLMSFLTISCAVAPSQKDIQNANYQSPTSIIPENSVSSVPKETNINKEAQSIRLHDYEKVILKHGDKGRYVKNLQSLLNSHGFKCNISGTFDSETTVKVKAFQVQSNIQADGIVGKKTWKALRVSNKPVIETENVNQSNHIANQLDHLKLFLSRYCKTYENKNLNKFTTFFAPDATENNKTFHELLPRYRRNFEMIESLDYRIELDPHSVVDEAGKTTVKGKYIIRFLHHGELKEDTGNISMELIESGDSYLIKKLNYTSPSGEK